MKRYAWLSDIHLNFVDEDGRFDFYKTIRESEVDGVFITGDIAEGPSFDFFLVEMQDHIGHLKDIFYVLGNHDYYNSSFKSIRSDAHRVCYLSERIKYDILTNNTWILGQDGWADTRNGNVRESHVRLNDWRFIKELKDCEDHNALLKKLKKLADDDVKSLQDKLSRSMMYVNHLDDIVSPKDIDLDGPPYGIRKMILSDVINPTPQSQEKMHCVDSAATALKKIIILTHVPPFVENCMYRGKQSDDNFLPFYSCKAMGDMLIKMAKRYDTVDFLVLCGHTHGESFHQPLPNLICRSGNSEYSKPAIIDIIEVE